MGFGYAVYFAESDRNRVIRWDPDKGQAEVIAGEPAVPDPSQTLHKPYGLGMDASNQLLIADKLNYRIVRLKNGRFNVVTWRDTDGHRNKRPESRHSYLPGPPASPTGIFPEASGSILAAYFNDHTVYRIHSDGRLELLLGIPPSKPYHFTLVRETIPASEVKDAPIFQPAGIVKRTDGTLFLIERGYQVVREYHPARGLKSVFPVRRRPEWRAVTGMPSQVALADYHPAYPGAIALDAKENLYIAEVGHRCVLAVDIAGGQVRRVLESRRTLKMGGVSAIGFGPDGTAWVVDAGGGVVEAYKPVAKGAWKALGVQLNRIKGEALQLSIGGGSVVTGP